MKRCCRRRRFGRPVSGSCAAWWRSSRSASLRAVTSSIWISRIRGWSGALCRRVAAVPPSQIVVPVWAAGTSRSNRYGPLPAATCFDLALGLVRLLVPQVVDQSRPEQLVRGVAGDPAERVVHPQDPAELRPVERDRRHPVAGALEDQPERRLARLQPGLLGQQLDRSAGPCRSPARPGSRRSPAAPGGSDRAGAGPRAGRPTASRPARRPTSAAARTARPAGATRPVRRRPVRRAPSRPPRPRAAARAARTAACPTRPRSRTRRRRCPPR